MNETTVQRVDSQHYSVKIKGIDFGTLEKSQVREIIQILDNGVYQ